MKTDPNIQSTLFEKVQDPASESGPVTCLGMTFPNDAARRDHFLGILREKLKDPEFRKIEGFPIGADEDILNLSDPPYYTACPNPWIADFIAEWEAQKPEQPEGYRYHREPFAADVSEGKNDPIYNAHSYHTKVPHKAIMRYILHYTEPGDIVFDGFCGSGMTGVAAQMCGDRSAVESLGYLVDRDGVIKKQETDDSGNTVWRPFSKLGARKVVLNDLSPAATFIASNYNGGIHKELYADEIDRVIESVGAIGRDNWTLSMPNGFEAVIAYIVWSDVFHCNNCSREIVFSISSVDDETGKVSKEIKCQYCGMTAPKRSLSRPYVTETSGGFGRTTRFPKMEPVIVGIVDANGRDIYEVSPTPDQRDAIISRQAIDPVLVGFPDVPLDCGWEMYRHGMSKHYVKSHVNLYIPVNAYTLSRIWGVIMRVQADRLRYRLMWVFTSIVFRCSKFNRRLPSGGGAPISGVLYIPSMIRQENPVILFVRKLNEVFKTALCDMYGYSGGHCIYTGDLGDIKNINNLKNTVDYVFLDPPFGANIFYADMNFIWESWISVVTNRKPEAIISDRALSGRKSLEDYAALMCRCFASIHYLLKPGRWLTVEFHNSSNSVWNAISVSLQRAGFVIADIRTLDKKQKSFRQTTAAGAVKQDLVISAYKPTDILETRFKHTVSNEDGVWDFVRTHLKQLPVFVSKDSQVEVITERQNYLLFDRMVAFHVQRGVTVPLSASEFYAGLTQRFPERDGMYFLPEQVADYDRKRMTVREVLQLELFVTDEASAIQWLKQQLLKRPQTFQELHPQFLRETNGWQQHEKALELSELLQQNFLCYDGKGLVPEQIHAYLSTNWKELRNLPKDDPVLVAKARDRWYVPDPNKAGDVEKLRERALLREFDVYKQEKKKLKVFRLEAVRAGFKKAWQERDYATIIAVADRIPHTVLEEDPKLLMWYDQAVTRMGEE